MKCKTEGQLVILIDMIKKNGFPTGSAIYGPFSKESDFDFVMTEEQGRKMARKVGIDPSMCNCRIYAQVFMSFTLD